MSEVRLEQLNAFPQVLFPELGDDAYADHRLKQAD